MSTENTKINDYPRPDFTRKQWIDLNGKWDFEWDDSNRGETEQWFSDHKFQSEILVPYCYQSSLSGIHDKAMHPVVWYRKDLILDAEFLDKRVLLNFGAVDFETKVWINGQFLGQHTGGNCSFSFDASLLLKSGKNSIVIRVEDQADPVQPRGKQNWREKPFGCWYTPTTGIWQSVWLAKVGKTYLESLYITPDIDTKSAKMDLSIRHFTPGLTIKAELNFKGAPFKTMEVSSNSRYPVITVNIDIDDELDSDFLWNPENPNLFDVKISLLNQGMLVDSVSSYFGMRKISIQKGVILLNNVPYLQKLILDQGYWENGLLTAPSDDALKEDILKAKAMGFNGARKHQKMEDPRYYYWADRLGFLVWGEMPSNYHFSRKGIELIATEWQDFIKRSYNHPSIVAWVPVNESWGVWNIIVDKQKQQFCDMLYHLTKSLDPSRIVSSNDGWEQGKSDICAIHDYTADGKDFLEKASRKEKYLETYSDSRFIYAQGYKYEGQPVILTEYGGIAFDDGLEGWGYQGKVKNEAEFLDRFKSITEAILQTGYFFGFCYTQLTDVQQEINGLLRPDRSFKVAPEKIKKILDGLR
ncbi:glycoside hydrolase family 2 protein [Oceanispirochaeta sp.]|jgi:beta-galactosidase/beta-glucuronidase|uniref:glycoside hydrolase family 2 protein n=1 Tax=Oceanispirochaeta sp. TaxID=2035350 RepID=UPI00260EDFB2|nr:sugar-binding domain-containing protein [Oceanispirochaeta sp.]MDA3956719.1 beta galactosidase jelly roll domain-containing protein [Oceanispirochaeta sp.]